MILINISNQIGAGPRNISLNFIRACGAAPNPQDFLFLATDDPAIVSALEASEVRYVSVPTVARKIPKPARFLLIQFLLFWLTHTNRCEKALAFGNFFLVGRAGRKGVLLHHPYLVDDDLLARLPRLPRFLERVKRRLFAYTLRRVDVVIVQSDYMREMFKTAYPNFNREFVVIPNPVSDSIRATSTAVAIGPETRKDTFAEKSFYSLIYASRFYPHKNHAFLLDLARAFVARNVPMEVIVTLDPDIPGVSEFLDAVAREHLPIRNLGEISQSALAQAYGEADAAIFPSRAETFGNPLVEALQFALPVVAPRKGYAMAVLGDSGIYYDEDDVEGCVDAFLGLFDTAEGYSKACAAAQEQGKFFPDSQTWFQRLVGALDV